jgi:hypothetical protein
MLTFLPRNPHDGEILYSASGWSTGIERELGRKLSSAIQAAKNQKD